MRMISKKLVIIGAGPVGSYLSIKLKQIGFDDFIILEARDSIGGILRYLKHVDLVHPDTGERIKAFEFLSWLRDEMSRLDVEALTETTAIDIKKGFKIICVNPVNGVMVINAEKVIVATGGKEVNQYDLRIVGSRPSGVFTALLAVKLMDIFGKRIGRNIVIYGHNELVRETIIRAKEMGSNIKYIVTNIPSKEISEEIKKIADEEGIEILDNFIVSRMYGLKRLAGIEVRSLNTTESQKIECDTLVLSHGFMPDLTIINKVGAEIDFNKLEPKRNEYFETTIKNLFVAGLAAQRKIFLEEIFDGTQRLLDRLRTS